MLLCAYCFLIHTNIYKTQLISLHPHTVALVTAALPDEYAHRTLQFAAKQLTTSRHVEFYLQWACTLLTQHGPKEDALSRHALLALHESLSRKYEQLSKVCDFNKYTLRVLGSVVTSEAAAANGEEDMDGSGDDEEELVLVRAPQNGHADESMDDDDGSDDGSESD